MATWDQLYLSKQDLRLAPEGSVGNFVQIVQDRFAKRAVRIWDHGCGAGRHVQAIAQLGGVAFGSDNAPNGIERAAELMKSLKLPCSLSIADMTERPWIEPFHGIVSWNVINHNRLSEITKTIAMWKDGLVPGGLLLVTLKSTRADRYGKGEEIEPNTFVQSDGPETGVIHHYFDEEEIRSLFADWRIEILAEQVVTYKDVNRDLMRMRPFLYTTWNMIASVE